MRKLKGTLSSESARNAFAALAAAGYKPGRSDLPEIELIQDGGESLGFAVCESGPSIDEPIRLLILELNELGEKYFEEIKSQPFPTNTCSPGQLP